MKNRITNIFIFLIALSYTGLVYSSTCEDMKIKIIYDRKTKINKEKMCRFIESDKTMYFMSESCLFYACDVLKKKKVKLVIPDYYSSIGSPGFKLCRDLGGLPQIYEYQEKQNKNWESTERCIFNDKDFVEISFLTYEWKNYISTK